MSARSSMRRLERLARAKWSGTCACRGQVPLVTCHDGVPQAPGWPDPRCPGCGRERKVIVLNIVHAPPKRIVRDPATGSFTP